MPAEDESPDTKVSGPSDELWLRCLAAHAAAVLVTHALLFPLIWWAYHLLGFKALVASPILAFVPVLLRPSILVALLSWSVAIAGSFTIVWAQMDF